MIDYLNPSRISANPPEGTEKNCTTKSTKTAPQRENAESEKIIRDADYTDTTQDYTDEEADNG